MHYRFRSAREWQILEGMAVIAYAKNEADAQRITAALNYAEAAKTTPSSANSAAVRDGAEVG